METEGRNIFTTIELIKGVIPPSRFGFISDLNKLKVRATHTAPETMGERWVQLSDIVDHYIKPEDVLHYQWMATVVAVFTNRSVEEIVAHAREHRFA